MRWRSGVGLLCVAVTLAGGCATFTRVRFEVDPSGLDYVQFVQHNRMADGRLYTVKLELQGSGLLTYQAGTSERARSGLWQSPDDPTWQDLRTDRKVLPAETTRDALQRIVDAGAFDRDRDLNPDGLEHPLFVQARIGSERRIFVTGESSFTAIYNALLQQLVR